MCLNHPWAIMQVMNKSCRDIQALSGFMETWGNLPEQIALEVHLYHGSKAVRTTTAKNKQQLSLLFGHLANLGYAVVLRDDNPHANVGCCSEFTFLRVETRLV
jgi:hypothetical protein